MLHDLTAKQTGERVKICKERHANLQDQRFYRRIVTCDEKWMYLLNTNKSNQWLSPGQPAQLVVRNKGDALRLVELQGISSLRTCTRG